ncbi:MAG: radical SAM protein [Deltaproteobacteria bacterium]|nr:radical SAM protein [Deltaproteobacteria bacterium]
MNHPLNAVKRTPKICIWEITRACNLRCVHCENVCGPKSARELSLTRCVEVAKDLASLGCEVVEMTGGEPFLSPYWEELCKAVHRMGMKVAVATNGTLLTDPILDRAEEAGVRVIAISLDGLKDVHDRLRIGKDTDDSPWERAVSGIIKSKERFVTKVITQVNVLNISQMDGIHGLLQELGVEHWQIQLTIPMGRLLTKKEPLVLAPAALEGLASFIVSAKTNREEGPFITVSDTIGYYTDKEMVLRRREAGPGVWLGCQGGIRVVAITYDGKVRGCSMLPAEFDVGDLHNESLKEIWNDESRFASFICFDKKKLTGNCARCRVAHICRAGCTTMAYWTTGTIHQNPYCLLHLEQGLE